MTDILVSSPSSMAFSIKGQNSPSGTASAGTDTGTTCATDWISIPCATNTLSPTAQSGGTPTGQGCVDRICGMVFNSVLQAAGSSAAPVNSK